MEQQDEQQEVPETSPPGNKGSVKVRSIGTDAHPPGNQPHLDCAFQVDFYGFPGSGADVTFRSHAPTEPTGEVLASAPVAFDSDDPNPRGNALVGRATFDLHDAVSGLTRHDQQGYHVKLTVEAEGPQGANTKHMVFWIDCGEEPAAADDDAVAGVAQREGEPDDDRDDDAAADAEADDEIEVLGAQVTAGDARDVEVLSVRGAVEPQVTAGAPGAGAVLGAAGALARTGLGLAALLGAALVALGGGAAAVRAGRRR